MTSLSDVLSTPIIQTLGLTLLHFLWQGTLIAIVFALVLYMLKASSSNLRYNLSCFALVLMVIAPVATFIYLMPSVKPTYTFIEEPRVVLVSATVNAEVSEMPTVATATPATTTAPATQSRTLPRIKSFKQYLPYLVASWLLGVVTLSARLLGGLWLTYKLRTRGIKPVAEVLESKLYALTKKLELAKKVRLRESVLVNIPVVIGWLKPVILLPVSTLAGLSMEQLELILAHELAHIRRNDYIVNILQKIAETLLFYHPAIWWMSGVIRQERENCCDDLAIQLCQSDKLNYARTLAHLETLRPLNQIALAANGGSLLKRIQRLAGTQPTEVNNPAQWLIGACLAFLPWMILSVAIAQNNFPQPIKDNFDTFVNERLEKENLPGLQTVVVRDGKVVFNKAYGLANVENNIPMTVDTPMPVGTLSRAFTVIAIMRLVEQGKLNLDGTLADYLSWITLPNDEQNNQTLRALIKPERILATPEWDPDLDCDPDCVSLIGAEDISKKADIESLMPNALDLTIKGNPKNRAFWTAVLLGLIIEEVTGMGYEEYIQASVLEPMNIDATFDLKEAQQEGLPMGYKAVLGETLEPRPYVSHSIFNPYMGLVMNSQEVAKFLLALLAKDPNILRRETWSILLSTSSDIQLFGGLNTNELPETAGFGRKDLVLISNLDNRYLVFNIYHEDNTAHFTMGNWQSSTFERNLAIADMPLVTVTNLFRNENEAFETSPFASQTWGNPSAARIERLVGSYVSAARPLELFGVGEELHGTLAGHEFKIVLIANDKYLARSDYRPLDGIEMMMYGDWIDVSEFWLLAVRVKDSE